MIHGACHIHATCVVKNQKNVAILVLCFVILVSHLELFFKIIYFLKGPCPPCPKMVKNTCYCSKSNQVTRRCCNKFWSCDKKCNKLLKCKQHLCEHICHPGDCQQCDKTSLQFCKCKKKRKETPCTEIIWECGQVNLKKLN